MTGGRVCIIAFSGLAHDARVQRQARYLARAGHAVTVIGFAPLPAPEPGVRWLAVSEAVAAPQRALTFMLLLAGRITPKAYQTWFAAKRHFREAKRLGVAANPDVVYANDWQTLPIALDIARSGPKVVFDAHEYSPKEFEHLAWWRALYAPLITHVLRVHAPLCDAWITVCEPIAARLESEFGIPRPLVVLNAPASVALPTRKNWVPTKLRLIHHGGAIRARRLERMIDVVAESGPRVSLTLMLLGDADYIDELRTYAAKRAPDRVHFIPPVSPDQVVAVLAEYDMGIFLLETHIYNYAVSLPNKLFDFVVAGLPVCIGPSPSMAKLVEEYGFGLVAQNFEPSTVAAMLDEMTPARYGQLESAARRAARLLNADVELQKVVGVIDRLITAPSYMFTEDKCES